MNKLKVLTGLILYLLSGFGFAMFLMHPTNVNFILLIISLPIFLLAALYTLLLTRRAFVSPFHELRSRVYFTTIGLILFSLVFIFNFSLSRLEFNMRRSSMEHLIITTPITNSWLSSGRDEVKIPAELADYVYSIAIKRSSAGGTEANFIFVGSFSLHHYYWYYNTNDSPPTVEGGGYRKLDTCWYYVSD